jgi:hypothetical protein
MGMDVQHEEEGWILTLRTLKNQTSIKRFQQFIKDIKKIKILNCCTA